MTKGNEKSMAEPSRQNIRQINSHFVEQRALMEKEAARRKRGVLRRVIALTIMFSVLASIGIMSIHAQNQTLETKSLEKAQLEQQLQSLVKQESELKQEIDALNDLDFIAEIARRDYYLTKEGEILFKIPKSTSN